MIYGRRKTNYAGVHRAQKTAEAIAVFALIVLFLFFLFRFVWTPVRVEGKSMQPVLENGDVVFVDRLYKYLHRPKRGDIVAYRDADGYCYIKRIIGLSGETVEIDSNTVFINGAVLNESSYLHPASAETDDYEGKTPVDDRSYFVLSDYRFDHSDSRCEDTGFVSVDDVIGIVRFRIYPFHKINIFCSE